MWRDWEKKTLGELADINMGQSPDSSSVSEDNRKGMPFLQGNAEFGVKFPTPHLYCTQPKKKCSEGDFLISVRAPVGALNVANQNYCIGRGLAALNVPKEKPSYLWHALNNFAPELAAVSQGSTFDAINSNNLAELEFHLPKDEKEQKAIAEILDTVDEAIATTQAMLDKQDKIKDGLLQDLLTRGVDANGKLRPAYKDAPDLYKQSPLGFIPKEWEAMNIGSFCTVKRGASPRPIDDPSYFANEGRGWIRISDVSASYKYLHKTEQYLSPKGEVRSVTVNKSDLIMSICATIGKPILLSIDACIHDGFVTFTDLSNSIDKEFMFYFLVKNQIEINKEKQVGTQGNLNSTIVSNTLMPIPRKNEQIIIRNILSNLDTDKSELYSELTKLKKLKVGLMQDLLTGKKRIPKNKRNAA